MADTSRAAQLADPRRRPARPLVTGPRGPERPRGNHRASAGQSVAARRSRSARPGGSPRLAPSPRLADAAASAAASWGASAGPWRPLAKRYSEECLSVPVMRQVWEIMSTFPLFPSRLVPLRELWGSVAFQNFTGQCLKVNSRKKSS